MVFEKPLIRLKSHIVNQTADAPARIEKRRLRDELCAPGFTHLLGTSHSMEQVLKQARAVAATSHCVVDWREWN